MVQQWMGQQFSFGSRLDYFEYEHFEEQWN